MKPIDVVIRRLDDPPDKPVKYFLYKSKIANKDWLVGDTENAADYVYASNSDNKMGEGFGGRSLKFPLVDGSEYILNGGWHSNAYALFNHTGIDVRNKHLCRTIIGKEKEYTKDYQPVIKNVLYMEDNYSLQDYEEYKEKGKEICEKYNLDEVAIWHESLGGSSFGVYKKDELDKKNL
jgi:hypothetical protein